MLPLSATNRLPAPSTVHAIGAAEACCGAQAIGAAGNSRGADQRRDRPPVAATTFRIVWLPLSRDKQVADAIHRHAMGKVKRAAFLLPSVLPDILAVPASVVTPAATTTFPDRAVAAIRDE